jgi:hypothetical protein
MNACPTCRGRLQQIAAEWPTWHCGRCGTLLGGTERELKVRVPVIVRALADERDRCLRDDRGQCVVWLTAREVARCTSTEHR